jgi:hypothetical protein
MKWNEVCLFLQKMQVQDIPTKTRDMDFGCHTCHRNPRRDKFCSGILNFRPFSTIFTLHLCRFLKKTNFNSPLHQMLFAIVPLGGAPQQNPFQALLDGTKFTSLDGGPEFYNHQSQYQLYS